MRNISEKNFNISMENRHPASIFACAFVPLYGYNRIHMTNHFLTDVCFGTLITYLIHAVVSKALLPAEKTD